MSRQPVRPTRCAAQLRQPRSDGLRGVLPRIGYIGQGNGAGHSQRGRDELVSQGRSYGLGRSDARRRAAELIASLDLEEVVDRTVSTLSGGQRRRLDIVMGLIHAPDLLFLDEPSTGLDPQNRANLQQHVVALRETYGTTVVLTTHYLEEADALAERVVVIDHGLIIADDTPARLKADLSGDRITLGFASAVDAQGAARAARRTASGAVSIEIMASSLVIRVAEGPALLPDLMRALEVAAFPAVCVDVSRPTLDDVFLALTGRSLRDGPGESGAGSVLGADSAVGRESTGGAATQLSDIDPTKQEILA